MGMFDFLGGEDPSKKSMKYLNKIPGTVSPYYDPFINAGNEALPTLQNQYGQLTNDPGAKYAELGQGYQSSPGYNFALQQALSASGNAAAAGGMAGSPMHEQQNMDVASNMANRDYDEYMRQVMGLYGTGLEGEQGLYNTGYRASDTLAKMLADNLQSQAGLSYAGTANKNANTMGTMGMLYGGGQQASTSMLPYLMK